MAIEGRCPKNYLERAGAILREICPQFDLQKCELNSEGLINAVLIVNNELVFRFARDDFGLKTIANENLLLNHLKGKLPIEVPDPIYKGEGEMVYKWIAGKPFSWLEVKKLSLNARQRVASQLGDFLMALHSQQVPISLQRTPTPCMYEEWNQVYKKTKEKIFPLLHPHQVEWAENLFDNSLKLINLNNPNQIIHADLTPSHILYKPGSKQICGVIDFGLAGVGDPALDFGSLIYYYGESFLEDVLRNYPIDPECLWRARFYAQALEFQWLLNWQDSGQDSFITMHIGSAKDIGIMPKPNQGMD